ncbi:hypothetical protein [Mesorhizobium sp. 1B3]|uniref:hypothetical protein n=1 Tax=Mesorhizobium sp. 1B3 TaxID=3243599 RepID=UPI003D95A381
MSRFPFCPTHTGRFMVGRDRRGRWIVRDEMGLVGGLFADRASAVRFAMFESDYVPGAVSCVPDGALSDPVVEPVSARARLRPAA